MNRPKFYYTLLKTFYEHLELADTEDKRLEEYKEFRIVLRYLFHTEMNSWNLHRECVKRAKRKMGFIE